MMQAEEGRAEGRGAQVPESSRSKARAARHASRRVEGIRAVTDKTRSIVDANEGWNDFRAEAIREMIGWMAAMGVVLVRRQRCRRPPALDGRRAGVRRHGARLPISYRRTRRPSSPAERRGRTMKSMTASTSKAAGKVGAACARARPDAPGGRRTAGRTG